MEKGGIEMKKFTTALLAICAILFITGCSGGSGDLKSFLAEAEGDWYMYGDSSNEMLRISEDGAWELYMLPESGGEKFVGEQGGADSSVYDSENKVWNFGGEKYIYNCEMTGDGQMFFKGATFVAAHESRNLSERFDGKWYLDGDSEQDYYIFENGTWDFYESIGMGYSSTDTGYLVYRGGDTQELTAVESFVGDLFAVFSVVAEDEISLKDDGRSYLRLEGLDSESDEATPDYDDGDSSANAGITTGSFYYLDGDFDSYSLYFYDEIDFDFDTPEGETHEGTYSIDGNTLTIVFTETGVENTLEIEDDGATLIDDQGEHFYLEE
jgi:hypothetical protein